MKSDGEFAGAIGAKAVANAIFHYHPLHLSPGPLIKGLAFDGIAGFSAGAVAYDGIRRWA